MSDRSRNVVLTLGTIILVVVIAGWYTLAVWDIAELQTENRIRENHHTAEHAARAEQNIESTCVGLNLPALTECIREEIETERENQRAEYDLSAQQEMARWALWMVVLSGLTVAVTAIGVYFVRDTLRETAKTNKTAAEANRLSQKFYIADQRPWVSIDLILADGIKWDTNGGRLHFVATLKNSGKTPAIVTNINMLAYPSLAPDFAARQREISNQYRESPPPWGHSIFPDQTIRQSISTTLPDGQIEKLRETQMQQHGIDVRAFIPVVVGCVQYQSPYSREYHQTGFIYMITATTAGGGSFVINKDAGDIDLERLALQRWIEDGVTY